jgi:hypothetical protein
MNKDGYSRHKLFSKQVLKRLGENKLVELTAEYCSLLPLTQQQEYAGVEMPIFLSKVGKDLCVDFLYEKLQTINGGITDHEFTFRIKRVKYIKTTKDDVWFVLPENIHNHILEHAREDKLITLSAMDEKQEKIEQEMVEVEPTQVYKEKKDHKGIPSETKQWIVEHVSWHPKRREGTSFDGEMTVAQASRYLHLSPHSIRSFLYLHHKREYKSKTSQP